MGVSLFWTPIICDSRTLIFARKVLLVYLFLEDQGRFKVVLYSFIVVKF